MGVELEKGWPAPVVPDRRSGESTTIRVADQNQQQVESSDRTEIEHDFKAKGSSTKAVEMRREELKKATHFEMEKQINVYITLMTDPSYKSVHLLDKTYASILL